MAGKKQKILIIDDETDVHYSFQRLLSTQPLQVFSAENGSGGVSLVRKEKPDVVFLDIRLGDESGLDVLKEVRRINPNQLVIMMTAYGTSQTAIEAMKQGAFDYVLKPFDIPALMELLQRALESARSQEDPGAVATDVPVEDLASGIVGTSAAMQAVYKMVGQVAPSDATVLVVGESGTGKELVAKAIYSNSRRSSRVYMALNCAAIPENLLESELFGHEKGAFTGAVSQRIGKFEQCDGGTLFLDEIGEMPLATQSKLLRVLQEGEFSRVGGNETLKTDVRIVAATNRDLWKEVQAKTFREDLYYRLNVVCVEVPALRERLTDLPTLVNFFVNKGRKRTNTGPSKISAEAMEALSRYSWPGNVRELENCIQRALVLATGDSVLVKDLPGEVVSSRPRTVSVEKEVEVAPALPAEEVHESGDLNLERAFDLLFEYAKSDPNLALLPYVEREFIVRALQLTNGNQVKASQLLGITRATLRKRVEKFSIQRQIKVN